MPSIWRGWLIKQKESSASNRMRYLLNLNLSYPIKRLLIWYINTPFDSSNMLKLKMRIKWKTWEKKTLEKREKVLPSPRLSITKIIIIFERFFTEFMRWYWRNLPCWVNVLVLTMPPRFFTSLKRSLIANLSKCTTTFNSRKRVCSSWNFLHKKVHNSCRSQIEVTVSSEFYL